MALLPAGWETNFAEPEVGDLTIRLTFEEAAVSSSIRSITVSDGLLVEARDAAPPMEEFTAQGTGNYRVERDGLFADLTEPNMYVDGRDFVGGRRVPRGVQPGGGVYRRFYTGNLGPYRIGNTLSITTTPVDGEADTKELVRIDSSTAVTRTTWGSLKAAH